MTIATEGFTLGFSGDHLVLYPKGPTGTEVGHLEQMLPLKHCRTLTATRLPHRSVELAFDFQLPTWRVQIQVLVPTEELGPAAAFVTRLREAHPGIAYRETDAETVAAPASPSPPPPPPAPPEPEPMAEPAPDPRVAEEWISAPVSDETRALYRAVLGRLAAASGP